MVLDLNDPKSILRWWRIWPERHGQQLNAFAELEPQFAGSIAQAWQLIALEAPRG